MEKTLKTEHYVLMPKEPTEGILRALIAVIVTGDAEDAYSRMVEAAKAPATFLVSPSSSETTHTLLYVLSRIMSELPRNRDWLDPALEKLAKDAIAEASGKVA